MMLHEDGDNIGQWIEAEMDTLERQMILDYISLLKSWVRNALALLTIYTNFTQSGAHMIILIGSLNTNIWQKRKTITMYPSLISVYSQTKVRALVSKTLRRISLSTNLLSKIRHACRRRCLGYTYLLLRDEWTDENLNRPYECHV